MLSEEDGALEPLDEVPAPLETEIITLVDEETLTVADEVTPFGELDDVNSDWLVNRGLDEVTKLEFPPHEEINPSPARVKTLINRIFFIIRKYLSHLAIYQIHPRRLQLDQ